MSDRTTSLRQRRAAMRRDLAQRRAAARAALDRRRPPKRSRRRPWWLLPLVLVLLWMMVPECYCTAVPFDDPEPSGPAGTPEAPPVPATAAPLPDGRVPATARPAMPPPQVDPLPWLASFELQVTARSPRLAQCFEGTARPGALRWAATVEAASGAVSDHTLEPVLATDPLPAAQRACLQAVLSTPPYDLSPLDRRSTPPRVSLVIEF